MGVRFVTDVPVLVVRLIVPSQREPRSTWRKIHDSTRVPGSSRRIGVVKPTLVGSVAAGDPLWVLWLGPLILP